MTAPHSDSIFVPLRHEGDVFTDRGDRHHAGDTARQEALRALLPAMCAQETGRAEIKGRRYVTSMFVSKTDPLTAYVETDRDGIPIDAKPLRLGAHVIAEAAKRIAARFHESEALTPDTRIDLSAAFVPPRFEIIDDPHRDGGIVSWDSLGDHSRLVILGDPGAGKSTTLRRLIHEAASRPRWPGETMPIYIQLKAFAATELTVEGIARILRTDGVVEPELEFASSLGAGRMLLLLDGLDEMPSRSERAACLHHLTDLCAKAPNMRVVLTSRESTFAGELSGFTHLRILPFDTSQISQWVHQYVMMRRPSIDPHRIIENVRYDKSLAELTSNPLLLSYTTSVYCKYPHQVNDRASLIRKFLEVLIHDWDAARDLTRWADLAVTPRQIVALLADLAVLLITERRERFTLADIKRLTDEQIGFHEEPGTLLFACHTAGLIRSSEDGSWAFRHQTFEDYLSASHLVRRTDDVESSFDTYFRTPRRRQVWAFACATASDAGDLLNLAMNEEGLDSLTRTTMIAEALGQEMTASREVVRSSCALIVMTLEKALGKLRPVEDAPPEADDSLPLASGMEGGPSLPVAWSRRLTTVEPADDELDLGAVARLLTLVYETRAGAAAPILLALLKASSVAGVRDTAKFLEIDGLCRAGDTTYAGKPVLWFVVLRHEAVQTEAM